MGERHNWFVMLEILDQPNVQNFAGSWSENGSLIRVAIEKGHVTAQDGAGLGAPPDAETVRADR
jgi:hypothetical protein